MTDRKRQGNLLGFLSRSRKGNEESEEGISYGISQPIDEFELDQDRGLNREPANSTAATGTVGQHISESSAEILPYSDVEIAQSQTHNDEVSDEEIVDKVRDKSEFVAARAKPKRQKTDRSEYDFLPPQIHGGKTLRFQPCWLKKHSWLHVESHIPGVLCKICKDANELGLVPVGVADGRTEDVFVKTGYRNWKRALDKFRIHERSSGHNFASLQLAQHKAPAVNTQLSLHCAQQQLQARNALLHIISSVRYLARQGVALRGHDSSNGNLVQLLRLRSEDCADIKTWMDSRYKDYTSWKIQNEILESLAHAIVRELCEEIRAANSFAIVVDGTSDISHCEQEAISVRYVDASLKPNEVFLGFYHLDSGTDGQRMADMILDVLLRLNLPVSCLRGQTYDGGSNMAGKFNGAQAIIKMKQPLALFVHCLMHCGNLAVQEAIEASPIVRDAIALVNELGIICHQSTKLNNCMRRASKNMYDNSDECADEDEASAASHLNTVPRHSPNQTSHLRPLCPTRVLCRGPAVRAVLSDMERILDALQDYADESNGESAARARGLITSLGNGNVIIGLKIALQILSHLENLNRAVQCRQSSVSGMVTAMKLTSDSLQEMRKDEVFQSLFKETQELCAKLDVPTPAVPRQRRPPARYTGTAVAHSYRTPVEFYRVQYFEFLDAARSALERRYDQPGLLKYVELENVLLRNNSNEQVLEKTQSYPEVIVDKLVVQLAMFRQQGFDCKTVDSIAAKLLSLEPSVRALFSQIECVTRLLLTVPASNAEAERSFSGLRRLKTYLRNSMGQGRLNHVAVLHAHQERLDALNLIKIANDFVQKCQTRRVTFGKFI